MVHLNDCVFILIYNVFIEVLASLCAKLVKYYLHQVLRSFNFKRNKTHLKLSKI